MRRLTETVMYVPVVPHKRTFCTKPEGTGDAYPSSELSMEHPVIDCLEPTLTSRAETFADCDTGKLF